MCYLQYRAFLWHVPSEEETLGASPPSGVTKKSRKVCTSVPVVYLQHLVYWLGEGASPWRHKTGAKPVPETSPSPTKDSAPDVGFLSSVWQTAPALSIMFSSKQGMKGTSREAAPALPTFAPAFFDTPKTLPFLSITSIPFSNSGLLTAATVKALVKPAELKRPLLLKIQWDYLDNNVHNYAHFTFPVQQFTN